MMNFEMALGAMRVGGFVRRVIWNDIDHIFLRVTDAASCIEIGPSDTPTSYTPTMGDLLATDWVVIANTPVEPTVQEDTTQESTNE